MNNPNGPLIADCGTWLSIVTKLFGTRMALLLEPHGLTQGQFSILHHIARQPKDMGSRVSEIAAAVEVEQPAVTKTLAKFVTLGLVKMTPCSKDKRAKIVIAKPATAILLARIYQDIGPDLAQVFGALDTGDLEKFADMLKQLGQWLDANRLPPSSSKN